MSTETIKEFLVGLGFQVDEKQLANFNKGIFKAGAGATALGNIISDAARDIARNITEMLSVNRYAEELEKINDVSERTKVAAEDIFRMGYQAEQTGSDMHALTSSLDSLTKTAGLASIGMGRGQKVFEEIGVNVKDANGKLKDTGVLIAEIREAIKGMELGKQQAIIGRLGIDPTLIKMMTEDVSGLTAEYDEMVKASGFSANQAVKDADNYRDELGKLQTAVQLIGKSVASRLFNRFAESSERLRKMIVANMPAIIKAIESVIREVLYLANIFSTAVARIIAVLKGIIEFLGKANDATNGWLGTIALMIAAWRLFNLSVLATPLGMLLALAAALALIIEDFYVFKQGGESLIDWSRWEPGFNALIEAIYQVKDLLTALFTIIISWVDLIVSLLTGDFSGAWNAIKEHVQSVIDVISRAFGLARAFGDIVSGFSNAFSASGSMLTPSPATAASLNGSNVNMDQKTEIIVQGSTDPAATGRAVAGEQGRVNADLTRNLSSRTR